MLTSGNIELDGMIQEFQTQAQILSERAAVAYGQIASLKAENASLQAKITTLTPKAPE